MMDILSFPDVIEKIGNLLEKLIKTGRDRRINKVLHQLLTVYVRLGDVLDTSDEISNQLQAFANTNRANLDLISSLLIELIEKERVHLREAQLEIENLWHVIQMLDTKDEEYWGILGDVGLEGQRWVIDSIETALGDWQLFIIQQNPKAALPILYLPLKPMKSFSLYSREYLMQHESKSQDGLSIVIDLNQKNYSSDLDQALELFTKRKSILVIKEGRTRIKKIIQSHWTSDDILNAMISLKSHWREDEHH